MDNSHEKVQFAFFLIPKRLAERPLVAGTLTQLFESFEPIKDLSADSFSDLFYTTVTTESFAC